MLFRSTHDMASTRGASFVLVCGKDCEGHGGGQSRRQGRRGRRAKSDLRRAMAGAEASGESALGKDLPSKGWRRGVEEGVGRESRRKALSCPRHLSSCPSTQSQSVLPPCAERLARARPLPSLCTLISPSPRLQGVLLLRSALRRFRPCGPARWDIFRLCSSYGLSELMPQTSRSPSAGRRSVMTSKSRGRVCRLLHAYLSRPEQPILLGGTPPFQLTIIPVSCPS